MAGKEVQLLLIITFCGASDRHQGTVQWVMKATGVRTTATLVIELFTAPCTNIIKYNIKKGHVSPNNGLNHI